MSRLESVMKGLEILNEYFAADVCAEHDEFFAGGANAVPDQMKEEHVKQMEDLGWRWEESVDSWAIFV